MKTTGVNLALLCQIEETDSKIIDSILVSTDFGGLIERAKNGETDAAKNILGLAASYLASDVFGPMPSELRRYLGMALASISLGKQANEALNLSRPGRGRNNHITKLRLAHWMYKEMKNNGYDTASVNLRAYISKGIRESSNNEFFGYRKTPSVKRLRDIYDEVIPEIKQLYAEVQKSKSVVPKRYSD